MEAACATALRTTNELCPECVVASTSRMTLVLTIIHDNDTILSVGWNDAFHKVFKYSGWESIKELQYFCGRLDIIHVGLLSATITFSLHSYDIR